MLTPANQRKGRILMLGCILRFLISLCSGSFFGFHEFLFKVWYTPCSSRASSTYMSFCYPGCYFDPLPESSSQPRSAGNHKAIFAITNPAHMNPISTRYSPSFILVNPLCPFFSPCRESRLAYPARHNALILAELKFARQFRFTSAIHFLALLFIFGSPPEAC